MRVGSTSTGIERTPDGRRVVVRRTVDANERYIEPGSSGRVRLLDTVWLPYKITSCTEYRWTWDVARLDATGHFVSAHRDGAVVGFEVPVVADAESQFFVTRASDT